MRGRTGVIGAAAIAAVLAMPAAPAQPAPQQNAPPERIGPVWDYREHQPNPAEVEARERARGLPQASSPRRESDDVDRIYRDLTGSDPKAPPRSTQSRDMDRR